MKVCVFHSQLRADDDEFESMIEEKIPFLDMREEARQALANGDEPELHLFDDVHVLWSPEMKYAVVNEGTAGVGDSLVINAGDAPSPEFARDRWNGGLAHENDEDTDLSP